MQHVFEAKKLPKDKKNLVGLDLEQQMLKEFCSLVWSEQWLDVSKKFNFMPTILLYGPPGTGKTTLLQNIPLDFVEYNIEYYRESLDLLANKELGETSKAIKKLFEELKEQASCGKRVLLQIDDVDSLLSSRYLTNESSGIRRAVNTFLTQLDELLLSDLQMMPIIAASTNMFDYLDSAVKRRFSLKLEILPLLSEDNIKDLLDPLIKIINSDVKIDIKKVSDIVSEKKLTPNDLMLIMQKAYLDNLVRGKFSEKKLLDLMSLAESSQNTFDQQRDNFSMLRKKDNA